MAAGAYKRQLWYPGTCPSPNVPGSSGPFGSSQPLLDTALVEWRNYRPQSYNPVVQHVH
jgi:hypothetical protein